LDLILYLIGGLTAPTATLFLQFQMLLPAFSALVLGAFFFKDSPLYHQTNRTVSRWFVYYYLFFTFCYLAALIVGQVMPQQAPIIGSLLLPLSLVGLILLIVLRVKGGADAFASTGLAGGNWKVWLGYGVLLVAYNGLQTFLNYLFKLGQVMDLKTALPQLAASPIPKAALLPILAIQTVVVGPFLGLIISFGEEYGWRGYLQTELIRLGRIRGIFLLGVIWGIWHWPVIWMGYNFPGQPVLGSIAMVAICILLAFFLGYAVLKSKGVWSAAYLHALSNQSLSFFMVMLYMPTNILFSFGIGLPAMALGALIVLLILRDPIWKATD
jgi:membrane protease YdiL (CAAX protease family)